MLCPGCKGTLVTLASIERHNIACANTGERAYPAFPAPVRPPGGTGDDEDGFVHVPGLSRLGTRYRRPSVVPL